MGEKQQGMVSFVLTIVESLEKNGDLPDFLRILKEKGYLDKEETSKTESVADKTWYPDELEGYFRIFEDVEGDIDIRIARCIPSKEYADAIAALPNLVRAAKCTVNLWSDEARSGKTNLLVAALKEAGEL